MMVLLETAESVASKTFGYPDAAKRRAAVDPVESSANAGKSVCFAST